MSLATKSGTPRLSEIAQHVVVPSGIVSTGWPSVQGKCSELGIRFRPWQPDVGRLILAKREDGHYAATIGGTGLSIPRQVGKTFLVGAIIFALCLLRPGLTVIWTAHRLRTAEETFGKMQVFAKRSRIKPHILKLVLGSGEEEIRFRNGSRILFGARERGFGRGFDEVDVLIYDEAQILGESALDDMVPATNQSRQDTGALLLFMGTPPKPTDPGEVFSRMRSEALSGEDSDTGWVEFGAHPDFVPTPLPGALTPADWAQVAKANPSFPVETPRESILRMRKKLGPDSFLREGLGIWDPAPVEGAFPVGKWAAAADRGSMIVGRPALAVTMSPDGLIVSLAGAGKRADGRMHVEIIEHGTSGTWFTDKVIEVARRQGSEVTLHPGHAAGSMFQTFQDAGLRLNLINGTDYKAGCVAFADDVVNGRLKYLPPQPELDAAAARASRKTSGETWRWAGDGISALVAASQAAHAARKAPTSGGWMVTLR